MVDNTDRWFKLSHLKIPKELHVYRKKSGLYNNSKISNLYRIPPDTPLFIVQR